MREMTADIWAVEADGVCITTNGIRRKDGSAVMGAGLARQAASRYRGLASRLGGLLEEHGNHTQLLHLPGLEPWTGEQRALIALPTKQHWRDPTPPALLERSLTELTELSDALGLEAVALPEPGCGLGGLSWPEQVRPLCERLLDDRFIVVHYAPGQ